MSHAPNQAVRADACADACMDQHQRGVRSVKGMQRIVLAAPIVAALTAAAMPAQAAKPQVPATITIATVNNSDMIEMQKLTPIFERQYGINVKFDTLPENSVRQKVTPDLAPPAPEF